MRCASSLLSIIRVASAEARIGENAIQFADRYGFAAGIPRIRPRAPLDRERTRPRVLFPAPRRKPQRESQVTKISDINNPVVHGAVHHTYEYQGWRIRAAFLQLDGPAVRMEFQKLSGPGVSPAIQDYELQAIAAANTPPECRGSR